MPVSTEKFKEYFTTEGLYLSTGVSAKFKPIHGSFDVSPFTVAFHWKS